MRKGIVMLLGLFAVLAVAVVLDDAPVVPVSGDLVGVEMTEATPALLPSAVAVLVANGVDAYLPDIGKEVLVNCDRLHDVGLLAFEDFEPDSYRKEDPGNWYQDVAADRSFEYDANRPNSPPIVPGVMVAT